MRILFIISLLALSPLFSNLSFYIRRTSAQWVRIVKYARFHHAHENVADFRTGFIAIKNKHSSDFGLIVLSAAQ